VICQTLPETDYEVLPRCWRFVWEEHAAITACGFPSQILTGLTATVYMKACARSLDRDCVPADFVGRVHRRRWRR
jgi:hypothetical protein